MAKGTVKWFNVSKGFGFIQPEGGGKDVFVHVTAVREAGLETLDENQQVEFEMVDGRDGRQCAGEDLLGPPAGFNSSINQRKKYRISSMNGGGPPAPGDSLPT